MSPPTGRPRPALLAAEEALGLAQGDPDRARALASAALVDGLAAPDLEAAAVAERALGLVARVMNDAPASISHLRRSVRLADRAGCPNVAAESRVSLAFTLTMVGNVKAGMREVDRAGAVLQGLPLARAQMQRALILSRLGRNSEALEGYRKALPVLRRAGDELREARLLNNRGLLHLMGGSLSQAERDLTLSRKLFISLGQTAQAAGVAHNLGFLAARRGDVPAALARYDDAAEELDAIGVPAGLAVLPLCELLVAARLFDEARRYADRCVQQLESGGMANDLAEARLTLAEVALAGGDLPTAQQEATTALRAFTRQGRPGWAALARYSLVRVRWQQGDRSITMQEASCRAAAELQAHGWTVRSLDALLMSGRAALDGGRGEVARARLHAASRARFRGPVDLRTRAWHAQALLRLADGNRRGAMHALRAGISSVEAHRATLGATELRIQAGGHGEELASLGLRVALESAQPRLVLSWAERCRAATLNLRPVRPVDADDVAPDLLELRRLVSEIDRSALAGRDTTRLLSRQATLERVVIDKSRRARGTGTPEGQRLVFETLAAALDERALIEIVDCGGTLHALVVADGRCSLHPTARTQDVTCELEFLRSALRRLADNRTSGSSHRAALGAARHAARRLDGMLFAPLRRIGDRELVIVPTGPLHAMPWSVLPSMAGRPVTVAPSALLWQRSSARPLPAKPGPVVLVAGPGLEEAGHEVKMIAGHYPEAKLLVGAEATVGAVKRAMSGASLLHLAAHGTFRTDNPLFSSIHLHDGPLNVYDLEEVTHVPDGIVLACCDSGLAAVHPGDELMGLTSSLLALGTRTLIACMLPVPDGPARELMCALHDRLAAGESPAVALALAKEGLEKDDGHLYATTAALTCLGVG